MNINSNRRETWRDISWQPFWFSRNLNELSFLLQMLGSDDTVLYEYERLLNLDAPNIMAGHPTSEHDDMLHGMVWKSYLWVLAAYEIVRTINQVLQATDPSAEITSRSKVLKSDFERLRVPLAKFEPAKKHRDTDYRFPLGCTQPERGLCWAVADGVVISRMELSDKLIAFLLELKRYEPATDNG